ncbi:hypothetical protein P4G36_27710 (plasmid) [Escherichia coli]|uniref:hypothetical protein n=1 Tax=Enterobacteriaceae TaxID=543 RepID=UPI000972EBDC|nr:MULTISPECIES: hypothetical protein [Enterobacteriaceae]EFC4278585.1 hypothetical protein [Escherichia coli]EFK6687077.1 hypothetical protein [Escherichia coli]MDS1455418.1 hypothetical protein [Escherichia coli]MDS1461103.1 hypothetical protein [Escherichia coli]SIZ57599.1 Uncharacterised protein [Shigella sonnei]
MEIKKLTKWLLCAIDLGIYMTDAYGNDLKILPLKQNESVVDNSKESNNPVTDSLQNEQTVVQKNTTGSGSTVSAEILGEKTVLDNTPVSGAKSNSLSDIDKEIKKNMKCRILN